jgi:hypothetical protein
VTKFEIRKDKPPTLKEAQAFVGGFVQLVELKNGDQLLFDEEVKFKNYKRNQEATVLFVANFGPGDYIVGNALLLKGKARWT